MAAAQSDACHKLLAVIVANHLQRLREMNEKNDLLNDDEIDDSEYDDWKKRFDAEGKEISELQRSLQSLLKSPAA